MHAEGWEFESPWIHEMETLWAPAPHTGLLNRRPANGLGVRLSPFPRRVHGSTGERCDRTAEIEGSTPSGSTTSGWWRVGALLGLEPRVGRFDSCHPDEECRRSSAVERRVANAKIVGSIPIACSTCRRSTAVVQWFCKPKVIGSNPIVGSISPRRCQLAARSFRNREVRGSSPRRGSRVIDLCCMPRRVSYSDVIRAAKLYGHGGLCGVVALAIDEVVFDGRGELVAATNFHVSRLRNHPFVAHVAVKFAGRYYDATGQIAFEDLRGWGMIDPDDPDYWPDEDSNRPRLTADQAEDAVVVPLTAWGDPVSVIRNYTGMLEPWSEVYVTCEELIQCPTRREAVKALRAAKRRLLR